MWPDPDELLICLDVSGPEQIDVEAIAEYCGATIVYEPLKSCEARLVGHGDRAVITVDSGLGRHRRRFSAAHELGHWMLDRHRQAFACTRSMLAGGARDDGEQRANRWAADLLMPVRFFELDIYGKPLTLATVRELAQIYDTSLTATALQLLESSPHPGTLVLSCRDRRWRWFKHGPEVPDAFRIRPEPGPGTAAHALLRGARDDPGPVRVRADGWTTRCDACWYQVQEDSVAVGDGEVLTLLWWCEPGLLDSARHGRWLPRGPNRVVERLLVRTLCHTWGYRQVDDACGFTWLSNDRPVRGQIAVPQFQGLDAATIDEIVYDVTVQKQVSRDEVLESLVEAHAYKRRSRT